MPMANQVGAPHLLAGISVADITPPVGVELAGGAFGRSESVLHPLSARCLCLRHGDGAVVIVSCDLLAFGEDYARRIRDDIGRACGVGRDAVMLAATHTHAGPATVSLRAWGTPDPAYSSRLHDTLVRAAREAWDSTVPARVGAAHAQATGLAVNRAFGRETPVDDRVTIVKVEREDGSLIGLIVNATSHPVNLHSQAVITPDFPYYSEQLIQRRIRSSVPVLHLLDASGDINPRNFAWHEPLDAAERAACSSGTMLAEAVLEALATCTTSTVAVIGAGVETVHMPVLPLPAPDQLRAIAAQCRERIDTHRDHSPGNWDYSQDAAFLDWAEDALSVVEAGIQSGTVDMEIQVLRFGDWAVLGVPAELYSEVGAGIRRASPFPDLVIATLANGCGGYVATRGGHEVLRYEVTTAPRIIGLYTFAPEAGEVLREAAGRALTAATCRLP